MQELAALKLPVNPLNVDFVGKIWDFFQQAAKGTLKMVESASPSKPQKEESKEEKKPLTSSKTGSGVSPPAECAWIRVVVPYEKPAARRYSTAVLYNGKFYNFGGIAANKAPLNDFYVFNFGISVFLWSVS